MSYKKTNWTPTEIKKAHVYIQHNLTKLFLTYNNIKEDKNCDQEQTKENFSCYGAALKSIKMANPSSFFNGDISDISEELQLESLTQSLRLPDGDIRKAHEIVKGGLVNMVLSIAHLGSSSDYDKGQLAILKGYYETALGYIEVLRPVPQKKSADSNPGNIEKLLN